MSQVGPLPAGCDAFVGGGGTFSWGGDNDELRLIGTPSNLRFSARRTDPGGSGVVLTLEFTGALSGDVITGVVTFSMSGQVNIPGSGVSTFSGSAVSPVTLR